MKQFNLLARTLFVALSFLLCASTGFGATVIKYVTQKGAGLKDGSSWTNAYDSTGLQTAINTLATSGGGQVWVAKGSYYPTEDETGNKNPTDPRMKTFSLKKGVEVYGGFVGTETKLPSSGNGTWLSGEIGTTNTRADNCYNVVYSSNADTTAILNGFRICYGNATGGSIDRMNNGGGLYLDGGYIINCRIDGNKALNNGGGAYLTGAAVITSATTDSIFANEAQKGYGGGVYCVDGGTVTNMTIYLNTSIYGGGCAINGKGVLKKCTIGSPPNYTTISGVEMQNTQSNKASYGGGLWVSGESALVTNCVISGNAGGVCGNGIMAVNNVKLSNCMIECNTYQINYLYGGGVTFNSTMGGGVYLENSTIVNSTIRDNISTTAGGVYSKGNSKIIGCLIHNNSDAGVYVDGSGSSIVNSLIANNGDDNK